MEQQLTNREKALITYEILQKRKKIKELKKEKLIKKYTIERSNKRRKNLCNRVNHKRCKSGH